MKTEADIAVLSVTRNGREIGKRLCKTLSGCHGYTLSNLAGEGEDLIPFDPPLSDLVARIWGRYRSMIFVMAAGIVVRVIAPLLEDKRTDPAVLVIDEKGEHVISLVSGHIGGANALCRKAAQAISADPVITTATDLSGLPAVELWAADMGLAIENPDAVKRINASLVNGLCVGIFREGVAWIGDANGPWVSFDTLEGILGSSCEARVIVSSRRIRQVEQDPMTLILRPRNLVLGIGCNRGTSGKEIHEVVTGLLKREGFALQSVGRIATIDVKKDEAGLLDFAAKLSVPLVFYTRDELNAMPDGSGPSVWAEKELGVKGVCEQAAMKGAGADSLVIPKAVSGNVTAALAESRGASTL